MATTQVQWYSGKVVLGPTGTGTLLPALAPVNVVAPRNLMPTPVMGAYVYWHMAAGLRQPMVDIRFACRDVDGEVLSDAFLSLFFGRTADTAHDTTAVTGGLHIWDGYRGVSLGGVKGESITLAGSKGEIVTFSARFVAASITPLTSDPLPSAPTWSAAPVLSFNSVNFSGQLNNRVWSFMLSYANNHSPDMALDGTTFPAAWNAGMATADLQLTTQSRDDAYVPGAVSGGVPDGSPIEFTITGSSGAVTFTVANPHNQTPDNRIINPPRVMRQWQFLCLGADAQSSPVSYVTTF